MFLLFREEGFASLGWRETLLGRGDSRGHRDKRQVGRVHTRGTETRDRWVEYIIGAQRQETDE